MSFRLPTNLGAFIPPPSEQLTLVRPWRGTFVYPQAQQWHNARPQEIFVTAAETKDYKYAPALQSLDTGIACPLTVTPTSQVAASYFPPLSDFHPAPALGSPWSTDGQSAWHPGHPEMPGQGGFFVGGQGWGTAIEAPIYNPSEYNLELENSKLECSPATPVPIASRGFNQHGTTGTSRVYAIPDCLPSGSGTAGTWATDVQQFEPYWEHQGQPIMQQNVGAGPSIQPPPTIMYDTWQTTQSTGGTSGTVADANANNAFTEEVAEEEGPHQEPQTERPDRRRHKNNVRMLREWLGAKRWTRRLPSQKAALDAAADLIMARRLPVYNGHRLYRKNGNQVRTSAGRKLADLAYERRGGTREVYKTLSRYYLLGEGRLAWKSTQLLIRVLEDVYTLDPPPWGGFPG